MKQKVVNWKYQLAREVLPRCGCMRGNDKHRTAATGSWGISVLLCMILSGALPLFSQSAREPQKQQPKAQSPSSLTGCVDENNGRYLLIDARDMHPIAELQAVGFPNEGFAKYLGQKVTVRGSSDPDGSRPLFRVRGIETVSDTCTPESVGSQSEH